MKSVAARAVVLVACWLTFNGAGFGSSIWTEVGDAGGVGNLTGIHALLGPHPDDSIEAFLTCYGGAQGSRTIADTLDEPTIPVRILRVSLFDEQGTLLSAAPAYFYPTPLTVNDLPWLHCGQ
jgi:hypothetical protein